MQIDELLGVATVAAVGPSPDTPPQQIRTEKPLPTTGITMTTSIQPRTATSLPPQSPSSALIDVMNALHGLAQRIDAWLATRERAAQDRDTLARMSDRELLDIGLGRGTLKSIADGARVRDYRY